MKKILKLPNFVGNNVYFKTGTADTIVKILKLND